MKKYGFLLLVGLFLGCSKDDENLKGISLINLRFTHDIPNCVNGGNFEINCTEYIQFIDNSRVDALVGGSDIILPLNYYRRGNKIIMEGFNFEMSFRIQDEQTLIRISDNSIWQLN